jgi:hypothetical protein
MGLSILKKIGTKIKSWVKSPIFWARFLGYAIPLGLLLYVLYVNHLSSIFQTTNILNIGSLDDTKISELYLGPSPYLSERKINRDGITYRELNGMAFAVFKPNTSLNNTNISIEVQDNGISLIPPYLNFDPNGIKWDKSWDFTKGVPKDLKNNKAFHFDDATYFDGTARIEMASSSNMFEDGPFTVYVEWMPANSATSSQQIVGHFNWELWQNKDSVQFQIGRTNNAAGGTYIIKYPIDDNFFNQKHSAIAIYSPSDINGYIELFVDGKFCGRTYLGTDKIWPNYNGKENLSFGWSPHNFGKNPFFNGNLYKINISSKAIEFNKQKIYFTANGSEKTNIFIISATTTNFTQLKLNAF